MNATDTTTTRILFLSLIFCVIFVAVSGVASAQEEEDTVFISDASDIDGIRDDLSGDYVLANDIDMSEVGNHEPIGRRKNDEEFTGTFDGNGHVITGLTVVNPGGKDVGLFGAVEEGGVVTQVGLEDADIEGRGNVGGVVGLNKGNVTHSYAKGTVSGKDDNVGGVVGWNRGLLTRSYSDVAVTGNVNVGGVAGRNDAGGTVIQTYAVGTVSATAKSGGLVGMIGSKDQFDFQESILRNSYWDKSTTGQGEAYGNMRMGEGEVTISNVKGLATSEMQGTDVEERMTAFDFVGTWESTDGYPVLSWQASFIPGEDTPLPGFGVFGAAFALFVALLLRSETESDR